MLVNNFIGSIGGAILGFVAGIAFVVFTAIPQMFIWTILIGWWFNDVTEFMPTISAIELAIAIIWGTCWGWKEAYD